MKEEKFGSRIVHHNGLEYPQYYFQNEESIKFPFHIENYAQTEKIHPSIHSGMHTHTFYLILWITNGEGMHQVDFEKYAIAKDLILFLRPGMLHSTQPIKHLDGTAIMFTDFFVGDNNEMFEWNKLKRHIFGIGQEHMRCSVDDTCRDLLRQDVEELRSEFDNHKDSWQHINCFKSLLIKFLIDLRRYCTWNIVIPDINSNLGYNVFLNFEKLLESQFARQHNIAWYASELCTTVKSLTKYAHIYSRTTPSELLNNRILLEAKRFLAFSPLNANEISVNLGFKDPSNFAAFFKKNTHMTPLEFRKRSKDARLKPL